MMALLLHVMKTVVQLSPDENPLPVRSAHHIGRVCAHMGMDRAAVLATLAIEAGQARRLRIATQLAGVAVATRKR